MIKYKLVDIKQAPAIVYLGESVGKIDIEPAIDYLKWQFEYDYIVKSSLFPEAVLLYNTHNKNLFTMIPNKKKGDEQLARHNKLIEKRKQELETEWLDNASIEQIIDDRMAGRGKYYVDLQAYKLLFGDVDRPKNITKIIDVLLHTKH